MKVTVYEAKSKLSQMINHALDGEVVVITRNGKDTVRLVPERNDDEKKNWIGSWKGKAKIHEGFYAPLDEDETVKYLTGELTTPFPALPLMQKETLCSMMLKPKRAACIAP